MVVVFGSINIDFVCRVARFPHVGETVSGSSSSLHPGGKGANQALAAARAGARVHMYGAVGRDVFAGDALALLSCEGIDLSGVARVTTATGCASILVDDKGANCIVVVAGANALADPDSVPDDMLGKRVRCPICSEVFQEPAAAAESPLVSSFKDVKWGAAPPFLPHGAMMAVMAGDPAGTGPVSVRLKLPAGYRIAAHWHPTDEQVTVLSGSLTIGMGDKLNERKGQTLHAGGFGITPAHMNHYAWTKTGTVIQLNLMGPVALTYVNPADDPSKAGAK